MGLQLMVQDKTGPLRGVQCDLTLSHLIYIGNKYLKIALMFLLDSNSIKWRSLLKFNVEEQMEPIYIRNTHLLSYCVSSASPPLLEDVFTASLCGQKAYFSFEGHSDVHTDNYF